MSSLGEIKETGRGSFHRGIPARVETWEIVDNPGCFCNAQPTQSGTSKPCQLCLGDRCPSSCDAERGEEHGSASTNGPLEGYLSRLAKAGMDWSAGPRQATVCLLTLTKSGPACSSLEQSRKSYKPAYLPNLVGSQNMRL